MSNLIEQANLLKGLTNDRIALLMQNPVGDIPPFLVAAEAERRRAASQQATGDVGKESVVDMLTRQLANVPQNIQAPMRTPPKMPPPMMQPQMAGIGALPQGMANGGPVRRFDTGSLVTPTVASLAGVATGETREQYLARVKRERTDAMQPGKAKFLLQNPTVPKTEAQLAEEEVKAANTGLLSGFYSDESRYDAAQELKNVTTRTAAPPVSNGMTADDRRAPTNPAPDSAPPSSTTGTADTSPENKYKSMEADMRKRLEGLYGNEETSNWENAQKWFAMSQQIMNPDATLMQGLVNAGSAYAEISGDQAAKQRQSERAREEALLNYDLQIMQGDRASEAAAAAKADERAFELQKGRQLRPSDAIGALGDLIKGIDKRLEDSGMMLDDATKESLMKERQMYEIQLSNIMKSGGYGASGVVTIDDVNAAIGAGAR
jgi:hypothetical protein